MDRSLWPAACNVSLQVLSAAHATTAFRKTDHMTCTHFHTTIEAWLLSRQSWLTQSRLPMHSHQKDQGRTHMLPSLHQQWYADVLLCDYSFMSLPDDVPREHLCMVMIENGRRCVCVHCCIALLMPGPNMQVPQVTASCACNMRTQRLQKKQG